MGIGRLRPLVPIVKKFGQLLAKALIALCPMSGDNGMLEQLFLRLLR